jgi:hypothetical protein
MSTYTIATINDHLIAVVPNGVDIEAAIREEEERAGVTFDTRAVRVISGCTLTDEINAGDEVIYAGSELGFLTDEEGRRYKAAVIRPFDWIFSGVPTSLRRVGHWKRQNGAVLNSAAKKIDAHGANPWCFVADGRHFAQFAGAAEYAALSDLTEEEVNALLGWTEDDWEDI